MRTLWIASYPKSGSTWFRILLANLGQETPADINRLPEDRSIASARSHFDDVLLFPSGLMTHEECEQLRPAVHTAVGRGGDHVDPAVTPIDRISDTLFIKTHDAWLTTGDGAPVMGGAAAADGAILVVRDPRDIVASLAHHMGVDLDRAIEFMTDPASVLCGRRDLQPAQLRQRLSSWSGFNIGWLDQKELPVFVVRYEDLQRAPAETLTRALDFCGVEVSPGAVESAVHFASFATLSKQEQLHGFREAAPTGESRPFFRRGASGGWAEELTAAQCARIAGSLADGMARLGYAPLA